MEGGGSGGGGAALFDSPRGGTSPCRDPAHAKVANSGSVKMVIAR